MILQISTTHHPATDLGYLLHKSPSRLHEAELNFGKAKLFYPEANESRTTVAILTEVDPVALVRGRQGPGGEGGLFEQYVNDRPYASTSFLSSAMLEFFSTAMSGRSKERQELADSAIPLEATITAISCKGGEEMIRKFWEPLGYQVELERLNLDDKFTEWGPSHYYNLKLSCTMQIKDLLAHLYVLIPVLDNSKHYWVNKDEIKKLLNRGKGWLERHPEKETITRRYLAEQKVLTRLALAQLAEIDGNPEPDLVEEENAAAEEKVEKKINLHDVRLETVTAALKASGAHRILDLGCGEGKLLRHLLKEKQFSEIVGMDVSISVLERATSRLRVERMAPMQAARLKLIHGSLMYRDQRLSGYDAAAVVEVIEHLDPPRLAAFERVVFEFASPGTVIVTTPNREYNALFESMPEGAMRHRDHRFEWTREEFVIWANGIAERFGYRVQIQGVGPEDATHGCPSQMGVFTRGA